jgi:hypothetical protein
MIHKNKNYQILFYNIDYRIHFVMKVKNVKDLMETLYGGVEKHRV